MAIRYLDPEGGNDANDGLSFANRKKTLASATVSLAAGDEIRLIASEDPVSIGSCTWTDGSRSITIPSGMVKVIDELSTSWTVSANVTSGTSANRKSGGASTASTVVIAAGFTTGKVAYKALASAVDLSAFEFIFLHLMSNTATVTAGSLELRLCSDTAGNTAVATIPLDYDGFGYNTNFKQVWKDFGSALPSSINSIAIYANTDPGAVTLTLNHLIACKSRANANHISPLCLIGKNTAGEPEWYSINYFTETSAVLGAHPGSLENSNIPRPYKGTTETVTSYTLKPLMVGWSAAERTAAAPSGSSFTSPAYLSGGWSRTDMSTQTGESWLSGAAWASHAMINSGSGHLNVTNIGFCYYGTSPGRFLGGTHSFLGIVGCGINDTQTFSAASYAFEVTISQVWGSETGLQGSFASTSNYNIRLTVGRFHGCILSSSVMVSGGGNLQARQNSAFQHRITKSDNHAGYNTGITTSGLVSFIEGTIFGENGSNDLFINASNSLLYLNNCTFPAADPTVTYGGSGAVTASIIATNINGDPTKHKIFNRYYTIESDTTVRHTAVGYSWKFSPGSTTLLHSAFPVEMELAKVACVAGEPVTVTCWARRDNTGLTIGLKVPDGFLSGITKTTQEMTAAADTWEQLSITFTPTNAGVVPIYGYAYGGTTYNGWFHELEVTQ